MLDERGLEEGLIVLDEEEELVANVQQRRQLADEVLGVNPDPGPLYRYLGEIHQYFQILSSLIYR